MTQGIHIYGPGREGNSHKKFAGRPASKTAVKRMLAAGHASGIHLEATSMFGNEYDGPITEAPDGTYTFVGPDPYAKRDFYGTIVKSGDTITVK